MDGSTYTLDELFLAIKQYLIHSTEAARAEDYGSVIDINQHLVHLMAEIYEKFTETSVIMQTITLDDLIDEDSATVN